jgi:hypothetical protein
MSTKQCIAVMQFLLPIDYCCSVHTAARWSSVVKIDQFRLIQTYEIGGGHELCASERIRLTPPSPCHTLSHHTDPLPHPKRDIIIEWPLIEYAFFRVERSTPVLGYRRHTSSRVQYAVRIYIESPQNPMSVLIDYR